MGEGWAGGHGICACSSEGLALIQQCLTCSVEEGAMTAETAIEVAQVMRPSFVNNGSPTYELIVVMS